MVGLAPIVSEETAKMPWIATEELLARMEQRSRSKARKILGVSDSSGWHAQNDLTGGTKKPSTKGSRINWPFSDLRGALTGTHRQNNKAQMPARTAAFGSTGNDLDSASSTPSPTFDPTASTSTLPSVCSSPLTPCLKHQPGYVQELGTSDDIVTRFLRVRKTSGSEMHTIAESPANFGEFRHQKSYDLPPLDLPPLSPASTDTKTGLRSPLARNRSTASVITGGSDSISKGRWLRRMSYTSAEQENLFRRAPLEQIHKKNGPRTGKHVREWLESADLNRSPSMGERPLARPYDAFHNIRRHAFSPTSSCTSIRTLTSQPEVSNMPDSPGPHTTRWPLPVAGLNIEARNSRNQVRSRKVFKGDLRIESVLSLSSDEEEEDDVEERSRATLRLSQSTTRSGNTAESASIYSRGRKASSATTASSIIQLDSSTVTPLKSTSFPSRFSKPVEVHRLPPKRALANIAASSVGCRPEAFSAVKSQHNNQTDLGLRVSAAAHYELSAECRNTPPMEPLTAKVWDTAKMPEKHDMGLNSQKKSATVGAYGLSKTTEHHVNFRVPSTDHLEDAEAEDHEMVDEELDISSFPVPPRSRSNSLIPKIQIQLMDDVQKRESRPPLPEFPADAAVLLTRSIASQVSSIKPQSSLLSTESSVNQLPLQPQELPGSEVDPSLNGFDSSEARETDGSASRRALQRTRTISNVPIYVTGLEDYGDGLDANSKDDVATFVFSNLY
ncbi:MAG: hypothetical protein LQ340_003590 [Diploschistes diacapsis]|nr:MAG: hypothetical protein LQ340_003590 [Diploschistes diacapsis]